jgi:intergrase/recombinase|tara:strand:+ start:80 stop:292 length:213 start_codon:yes stop_codon:yes gene_type:complete
MNKGKNTMKKKKVKMNTIEDMSDGLMSKFGVMKNNVEFMVGSEDNAISDEDYATCEALAQDGESIEDYAI